MKKFISEEWKLGGIGHEDYEFIDVAVNADNELFIDPCLIEQMESDWGKRATGLLKSFFDSLFAAYVSKNKYQKLTLLSHAGEQNGTRLGYGNGHNGKGNTAKGLINDFRPLEVLINEITTISKPQDLPIFIPGFAEDGMSDLITNVLHEMLNEFTIQQMIKYGIKSNGMTMFYSWDMEKSEWKKVRKPSYLIDGYELLLVPKCIVRKNYLFGTGQYFTRVIIERIRNDGGFVTPDGQLIPKRDIVSSMRYTGTHWMYEKVMDYSKQHNDALEEYHKRLSFFYRENGGPMTDEELDKAIYGKAVTKSA